MRFWKRWLSISLVTAATGMAQTWHDRFAEVNGVKLHYVEEGKGELILFLHGFPEFWYEWKDLIPEFAKTIMRWRRTCAATTFRNGRRRRELRGPVIVEDIRALAVEMKAKKFVLVGTIGAE